MSGILHSVVRIGHQLWGTLSKKKFFSPRPMVVEHDPASERPRDLDDPFFDVKVQGALPKRLPPQRRTNQDESENFSSHRPGAGGDAELSQPTTVP
jgi:hypothetical protein